MTTLVAKEVLYFSQFDEDAFFEWLNKIGCVRDVRGVGRELLIALKDTDISDADLRELIALFHRYEVDMKQLQKFVTPANKSWLQDDANAFWHAEIFEA